MKDQKKIGISISYLNLALNTVISVLLTPFIIKQLGDDNYSIYKVMQAFAGPLIMFNLGVSTIVARAIVKYETLEEHDLKKKKNTLALAMLTSLIMAVVVGIVGGIMCFHIPKIYGSNYSINLIKKGQIIFAVFVLSTILYILTDVFNGCAIGHEKFAFNSGMALLRNVLRVPLIVIFLKIGFGAIAITIIDCVVAAIVFLISVVYSLGVLKEYPKLTYIDKKELLEMLSFSAAILLQAIVNQVNNNVDTMLLGALVSEKTIITMYSSALLIYGVYNSIVSVMASFFLPKATKLVTKNASGEELTNFVIKPGRYQAMIAVAIVVGFAVFGKDFISIWIGEQYIDAYYITLILIIPVTIPLVENAAISILDAALKRIFRSVVLVIMAILNVLVSIILIRIIGFWGAALGTFVSLCIGHIVLMNYYYAYTFKMNILRMFKEIFKGILPVGFFSGVICAPLFLIKTTNWCAFLVKGCMFLLIYCIGLWKKGLEEEEKYILKNMISK